MTSRDRLWRMFVYANCLAVVGVAIFLRAWKLDHVPGVNGDEAWMGVQALRLLDGKPVAWFTPTGNPVNVFHFLPQVCLHAVLPASITVLRLTMLISGILALALNYAFCLRTFGRRVAAISTIVLAVLPVNIAYSRFAWDASQSLLFTLPVVYGSLLAIRSDFKPWKWLALAIVAQLAAFVVHPTNIFVAPIIVVAACSAYWERLCRVLIPRAFSWHWCLVGVSTVFGLIGGCFLLERWILIAGRRLADTGQLKLFALRYVDFFSGSAIYQFISGTQRDPTDIATLLYRVAAWVTLGCLVLGTYRRLRRGRRPQLVLIMSVAVICFGFYLVAGPLAIAPGSERYGVCLVGSTALLAALGISWWTRPARRFATVAWLVVAWAMLGAFHTNYMHVFLTTGGESHRTFRTAVVEPKRAALLDIESRRSHDGPVCIIARQWWSYWPAAYFSYDSGDTYVVGYPGDDPLCLPEIDRASQLLSDDAFTARDMESLKMGVIRDAVDVQNVFLLRFVGVEGAEKIVTPQLAGNRETIIGDAANRPVLSIERSVSW